MIRLAETAGRAQRKLEVRLEARRARLQKKALKAGHKLFRKNTQRVLRSAAVESVTAV